MELSATAPTIRQRKYWQVIVFMSLSDLSCDKRMSVTEVAESTGFSRSWVRELVRRYNSLGARAFDAYKPHPVSNPKGRRPLLSSERQKELAAILDDYMAPDGSPWTVKSFKALMEEKVRRRVDNSTAWRYFHKLAPEHLRPKQTKVLMPSGECVLEAEYWERNLPAYIALGPQKRGRKKGKSKT